MLRRKAERAANETIKETVNIVDVPFTVIEQPNPTTSTEENTTSKIPLLEAPKTIHEKSKKIFGKKDPKPKREKYGKPLPDGVITRAISAKIDNDATSLSRDYCNSLRAGAFKENAYFDKKDRPYKMVKAFYDTSNCGTNEYENNAMDLVRFTNITRRAILGKPFKNEKIYNFLSKSYFEVKRIHGYDSMKFMAWAVPHSYLTGMFMDAKGRFLMIPKGNPELFPVWNAFINQQDDIRPEVKEKFLFDENGNCPYVTQHREDFTFDGAKTAHPEDDPPFDANDPADVGTIDLTGTDEKIKKGNKEMDQAYQTAMANDPDPTPIDPKAEVTMKPNVEKSDVKIEAPVVETPAPQNDDDFEPFAEDDESKGYSAGMTFGELIADQVQAGKINPAVVASVLSDKNRVTVDTLPKFIEDNNNQWSNIPRLSKFTSYVKEAGRSVIYGADAEYLGLIKGQIINEQGDILRELRLDPCVMYGDTLRVITTDNMKGDIRRETFIPISNKDIVTAAIYGPLNKTQRKTIVEALPRCLGDFRTKYSYLDKVDMRGIITPGTDIVGLPFDEWKQLVCNISNILKQPKFPVCRMRVSEYKNPDNFQLVCDPKVLCTYPSGILQEGSNVDAMNKGFFVNATSDSTKKDTEGYFYTGPDYNVGQNKKDDVNK